MARRKKNPEKVEATQNCQKNIGKAVKEIMRLKDLDQEQLCAKCNTEVGISFEQSGMSRILNGQRDASIYEYFVISQALGCDMNDLFVYVKKNAEKENVKEEDDKKGDVKEENNKEENLKEENIKTAKAAEPDTDSRGEEERSRTADHGACQFSITDIRGSSYEKLIEDPLSAELRPYMGTYHAFFFQTDSASRPGPLMEGNISLLPSEDDTPRCRVRFMFRPGRDYEQGSGKVSDKKWKAYEGNAVLSTADNYLHLAMFSEDIGEIVTISIPHFPTKGMDVKARLGVMLSLSSGNHTSPTIQRIYLSKDSLEEDQKVFVEGQLRLNGSSFLIGKEQFEKMKNDARIMDCFGRMSDAGVEEESFLCARPVTYYCFKEKDLMKYASQHGISRGTITKLISIMRRYSESPFMVKTGESQSRFIYDALYAS